MLELYWICCQAWFWPAFLFSYFSYSGNILIFRFPNILTITLQKGQRKCFALIYLNVFFQNIH